MHEAYPKSWQNRISTDIVLGAVGTTDEVTKTAIIPIQSRLDTARIITNAATSYTDSQVCIGRGLAKTKMTDIILGPIRVGPQAWFPWNNINGLIPLKYFSHVNAVSVGASTRTVANLLFTCAGRIHLWEPFDFDVADATSGWTTTITAGCTLVRSSTAVDDGFSLSIDTDADNEFAFMSKSIEGIVAASGYKWTMRCFLNLDKSASTVTTTTTTTIDGSSPILCGVRNGAGTSAFQLRLKGVQAATDEHYVCLNYPTGTGAIGTITGTTDLLDDKWYMIEAIIHPTDFSHKPGAQMVELNTYVLTDTTGVVGAIVNEGTASDGYMNTDLIFTETGKWGDQNGATGTSQMKFFTDQVLLVSESTVIT